MARSADGRRRGQTGAARPPHPAADWREALRGWVTAVKEKELEVGFDFALLEAVHHYARLSDVARAHATGMARAAAGHLKALGAQWSDAALFDFCVHPFLIHNATVRALELMRI